MIVYDRLYAQAMQRQQAEARAAVLASLRRAYGDRAEAILASLTHSPCSYCGGSGCHHCGGTGNDQGPGF